MAKYMAWAAIICIVIYVITLALSSIRNYGEPEDHEEYVETSTITIPLMASGVLSYVFGIATLILTIIGV